MKEIGLGVCRASRFAFLLALLVSGLALAQSPDPNAGKQLLRQFAGSDDVKEMADQCRYICDDPAVDLYTLSDASLETEKMVALDTRKPYTELPSAFRYRDDASFKACDVKRYYQRVAELRARTVTPANMSNAIIPLPQRKPDVGSPDVGSVAAIPQSGTEATGAAQEQSIEASKRPVRVVGPAFFPAE